MLAFVGTQAQCAALEAIVSRALGFPKAGVDTDTGLARTDGFGATVRWHLPFAHPTSGQWAHEVSARVAAIVNDAVASGRLTSAQKTALQNAIAAAVTLGADWVATDPGAIAPAH